LGVNLTDSSKRDKVGLKELIFWSQFSNFHLFAHSHLPNMGPPQTLKEK